MLKRNTSVGHGDPWHSFKKEHICNICKMFWDTFIMHLWLSHAIFLINLVDTSAFFFKD